MFPGFVDFGCWVLVVYFCGCVDCGLIWWWFAVWDVCLGVAAGRFGCRLVLVS